MKRDWMLSSSSTNFLFSFPFATIMTSPHTNFITDFQMHATVQGIWEEIFAPPPARAQSINFSSFQSCWVSETLSESLTAVSLLFLPVALVLAAVHVLPFLKTHPCYVPLGPACASVCSVWRSGHWLSRLKPGPVPLWRCKLPEIWALSFFKTRRQQVFISRTGDSEASPHFAAPWLSSSKSSPPLSRPPLPRCSLVVFKGVKPHQTWVTATDI